MPSFYKVELSVKSLHFCNRTNRRHLKAFDHLISYSDDLLTQKTREQLDSEKLQEEEEEEEVTPVSVAGSSLGRENLDMISSGR